MINSYVDLCDDRGAKGNAAAIHQARVAPKVSFMDLLKRLSKELDLYGKEAEEQSSKVEQLAAKGADEYDIKKQVCKRCY